MKTLILGGGSFKNKAWVDETQKQLLPEITSRVVYWNDWASGSDARIDFDAEIAKVLETIGPEPFNLLAKSVGSYIGLGAVGRVINQLKKLIVCGVPYKDFPEEELRNAYQPLKLVSADNAVIFQNEFDNHGSYEEAKKFLGKINPAIPVIRKTGEFSATHNYPYHQDFKNFFLGVQ